MDTPNDILKKIETPLIFASKDSYRHLYLIKDLEPAITGLVRRFKEKIEQEKTFASLAPAIAEMEAAFSGFDHLPPDKKKERLGDALNIYRRIKEALSDNNNLESAATEQRLHRSPDELRRNLERLSMPVQYIKGVGPKIAALFEKKGLMNVEDILYFCPRRYEDRRSIKKIASSETGHRETIVGEVIQVNDRNSYRRRVFEVLIGDGTGTITATWFKGNLAYLKKSFPLQARVILSGEIRNYAYGKNMVHPNFEILDTEDNDLLHFKRVIPIYSEVEGLRPKTLRRIMMNVIDSFAEAVTSPIPDDISKKRKLGSMEDALKNLHFPPNDCRIDQYNEVRSEPHRRIIYDEFFFLQLGMALKKKSRLVDQGIAFPRQGKLLGRFYHLLSFPLTKAQQRVISEIEADMARPCTMNRLLQGDVGSGKTVVAMAAMVNVCENGFQAAIMAPTEILAQQHHANIRKWADSLGLKVILLTGSSKAADRKNICSDIEKGIADIVIGTHALIQEQVSFKKLGLAIIDEQHRFGVMQRATLRSKGLSPDILVMTATPIPRTLAMTVYGDLDVSVIDELPPGKKPIRTKLFYEQHRPKVYQAIQKELAKGHQVFIVYPLVEESEALDLNDATQMAEHLQRDVFPEQRVGLIHGRMKSIHKEEVMTAFQQKETDILVSTTVIEVGIDIPDASLMVIEHAERFGLSQLHQLRGRVGRSDIPSYCILLAQHGGSEDAKKRLRVMEETSDGFRIAEEDLAIRGPGEFLGVRQSGLPDFRVASIVRDARLLNEAKTDAFDVIDRDPLLAMPEHKIMKDVLLARWKGRLELAKIG